MRAAAVVESQDQFDGWAADQEKIPKDNVSTGAAGGNGAGVYSDQVTK
jgi:heme/copper-type cytochrome/quinol oxidase subunit 2